MKTRPCSTGPWVSAVALVLASALAAAPAVKAAEQPPVPVASPAPTQPAPEVIRRDPALGVIFSVLPGYGLGHFLVGDQAGGIKFLALDLATTFVWALGPSIVAVAQGDAPDKATRNGFWVFLGGFVAWGAIKVWEAVDANSYAANHNRLAALEPLARVSVSVGDSGVRFGYRALSF